MGRLGSVDVPGKSGAVYKFAAYAINTTFKANRPAVYIVTQRRAAKTGVFKHRRLAVNQIDDLRQLPLDRSRISKSGTANCICVRSETDPAVRQAIQNDLSGS